MPSPRSFVSLSCSQLLLDYYIYGQPQICSDKAAYSFSDDLTHDFIPFFNRLLLCAIAKLIRMLRVPVSP